MNAAIEDTLLDLFQQVTEDPDHIPAMPIDALQEDSQERHLLASFHHMLECIQQSKQRTEEHWRENEEQYRAIFEASTDALVICDLQGVVVEANPAASRMSGEEYGEWIGQTISYPKPSGTQPSPNESPFQARDQFLNVPGTIQHKDGSVIPVEVRSIQFNYKGQPHILTIVRDISERLQAEQQLREREEQYRSVFEATSDGLFITDFDDGHLVEVNPAAYKMHGYGYQEFIALHPTAFIHPDSHPLFPEYLQTVKAGGQFHAQAMDVRKDGTIFPVEVYGTSFIYRGKPHVLGVVRDITERVEAEKQLREREEQYRSIFEATSDALLIRDLEDGHVVEANPAACQMYGYSYEEFIGLDARVITHPDSLRLLPDGLQTVRAGHRLQFQGLGLRKDGTSIHVEVRGVPFTYKGKPHLLGASRDISERVEAEKQLREKEEQYRSIFEATSDALAIIDLEGYYIEVNPAACQIFGYTREELIGQHVSTRSVTKSVTAQALETLQAGRSYAHSHLTGAAPSWGVRKDGSVFPFDAHGTPITYRGQSHSLIVARDVTEQVQAQQLLEQRVEERTRELASLLSISRTVASTLQLKPLLGLILDQLKMVVEYTGAAIFTRQGEELVLLDSRSPTPQEQLRQIRLLPRRLGPIWETITARQPLRLADVRDESALAQTLRTGMDELMDTMFSYVRACLFVPLTLKDQVMGMLALTANKADAFTPHHATLALAIANQAAIAIENAQLYTQAQELAALEERQKLARELHDSVSQALYGISLGAHAARTALERDLDGVAEPLDYVLSLAEAALAEMRALIFELRPESLETEGLVSALYKQAAATQARHELVVISELYEEPAISLHVKQELYRVAQEAMHNIVKHAHASQVVLRLEQYADMVVLEVRDNGAGFDTTASFPGHLGLHSMRERVTNLGGMFEIESAPGNGTRIGVRVPGGE